MHTESPKGRFAGITVLLVDDEPKLRTAVALRLKLRGFQTLEAADGHEAVQAITARSDINVVVLDQKLPGCDVSRVLADMKRLRPEIPVIVLTGLGRLDPSLERCRKKIFSFLEKPCDLDKLVQAMETACRPHSQNPREPAAGGREGAHGD
jgi:DNA-binding NtrC family response regulator